MAMQFVVANCGAIQVGRQRNRSLASFLWSRGLMDFTRAWYLMSSDFMPIMCGSMLLVPE